MREPVVIFTCAVGDEEAFRAVYCDPAGSAGPRIEMERTCGKDAMGNLIWLEAEDEHPTREVFALAFRKLGELLGLP